MLINLTPLKRVSTKQTCSGSVKRFPMGMSIKVSLQGLKLEEL